MKEMCYNHNYNYKFNVIRGEKLMFNFSLYSIILKIPAILIAFTFHEYAHAIVADRLGDKTPRFQGRLTLNPFVHIDILGFIMILIAGFGWAKPVETNPRVYKNYYKDDLKVSLAGPMANMIVAFAFSIVLGLFIRFVGILPIPNSLIQVMFDIIKAIISINIVLFFFNLLPLPGLDGFHVLRDLFPSSFYKWADQLHRYQMFILIIFVATPAASIIIGIPTNMVWKLFYNMATIIAG
jgi:Zn-dependent protease